METDDQVLLRRYCVEADHEAFNELVRRHLSLVYGAALRQVTNPAVAEEVTQLVFTRLAQRAHRLPSNVVLAGWLHADTRLTALQLLRSAQRRRVRETEVSDMQRMHEGLEPDWNQIRPVLDEALERLAAADRDALLLRFFEGRSLEEVGKACHLTEDAVRMRITRALGKLRDFLSARGIRTTAEALAIVLATHGTQAAPASLLAAVTASVLSVGAPAGATTITLLTMSHAKLAAIGIVAAMGVAVPVVWQFQDSRRLHMENQALRVELVTLRARQDESIELNEALRNNEARLARQELELARLRGALQQARQAQTPVRRDDPTAPPAQTVASNPEQPSVSEADINAFLQRPKVEQADILGHLRRQFMGQEERSDLAEFQRQRALAEAIRPKLDDLESDPTQFADFQSSFVKAVIGLEDESKLATIRQIVQETYQQAVTDRLDAKSRPQEDVDAWALRRDALDRKATRAVQELLSDEERARFDRACRGIMGIDLGLNDGIWHRFVLPDGGVVFPSEK